MQDIESIMFTNVSRFKRLNERKMEMLMNKYDLRKIDVEIIIYLANCRDKNTAKDIASMEMFTKGHISQSVKRMHESGYINITQDEKDLRVQHLNLTDKAEVVLEEMMVIRKEMDECVFAGVTDEEMQVMRNVFNKMCDNIMNEMNQ